MKRSGQGSKPVDMSSWRKLFEDGRVWSAVGVVRARSGDGSHFKQVDGDVLVDVDASPEGAQVWCRLGSGAGGNAIGLWRIPKPGTEVGILIPDGHFASDPMVVCTLSSGATPDGLDADTMLMVNDKDIKIISTGGDVDVNCPTDNAVNLGDPDGESDAVALNQKVLAELQAIKTAHNTHVHLLTIAGTTGTAATPVIEYNPGSSVGAENVNAT